MEGTDYEARERAKNFCPSGHWIGRSGIPRSPSDPSDPGEAIYCESCGKWLVREGPDEPWRHDESTERPEK
jgi:hypothetical protein